MSISDNDFGFLRGMVREHSGIILDSDKNYLVESRMTRLAEREGFKSLREMLSELRRMPNGPLRAQSVEAMTINETLFFRDYHPYEVLKKEVFPDLIEKRGAEQKINIWSAACSTGQEPYSVAMVIREHFPALLNWSVNIYASDISKEVLAQAQEGTYNLIEINRGLPAPLLIKYFEQNGQKWRVKDEVRSMVEFRQVNLTNPFPYYPEMDIILLRNVLIYFDVETKKEILSKMRRLLKPDGTLFLGSSESTLNLDDTFERAPFEHGSCFRLNGAVA